MHTHTGGTHHLPCGHLPPEGTIPPREGRGHNRGLERLRRQAVSSAHDSLDHLALDSISQCVTLWMSVAEIEGCQNLSRDEELSSSLAAKGATERFSFFIFLK